MRKSGVLMHITSLPGPYGVGTMGRCAFDFVDFLHSAGQGYWQILPLTPTGFGDSPYQSVSAFAGNPYLIDLSLLVEEGLLTRQELESFFWGEQQQVDFFALYSSKLSALELAYRRFDRYPELEAFFEENSPWLEDYCLYMALKEENGGRPWYDWQEPVRFREPGALGQAKQRLRQRIWFYAFVQYLFFRQWEELKGYANEKGILILGDVPIYVPLDSCEIWCRPELFCLDSRRMPTEVAGVPPDGFTADGQLWGNPLYRWEAHKAENYAWWLARLTHAARLYDTIRLDHFRGFEAYWAVPYGEKTARGGHWEKGPGMDFFRHLQKALPDTEFIAEDLGYLTPEVFALREETGYPGMKVLQFAFDSGEPNMYLPHTYKENTVCYTGTHDNMTLCQYLLSASPDTLAYAAEYMGLNEEEGFAWGIIRTALGSVSRLCIIPMQDYLELGASARMNFPGTMGGNWSWRADAEVFTPQLAEKIRRVTKLYGR